MGDQKSFSKRIKGILKMEVHYSFRLILFFLCLILGSFYIYRLNEDVSSQQKKYLFLDKRIHQIDELEIYFNTHLNIRHMELLSGNHPDVSLEKKNVENLNLWFEKFSGIIQEKELCDELKIEIDKLTDNLDVLKETMKNPLLVDSIPFYIQKYQEYFRNTQKKFSHFVQYSRDRFKETKSDLFIKYQTAYERMIRFYLSFIGILLFFLVFQWSSKMITLRGIIKKAENENKVFSGSPMLFLSQEIQRLEEIVEIQKTERILSQKEFFQQTENIKEELQGKNEEISKYREFMENILESVKESIIVINRNLMIDFFNRSADKLFEIRKNGRENHAVWRVIPFQEPETMKSEFQDVLDKGESFSLIPFEMNNKVFELEVFPLKAFNQVIYGATVLIRDVTLQKEMEEKITRVEKLASIGRMSASLAHEIKNPISGISTSLEMMMETADDPETISEILHEVERIDGIVNSLLNYARPLKPEFQSFSLKDIIKKAVSLFEIQARKNNVQLEMSSEDCLIHSDYHLIQQVLLNLMLNSLESIKSQGTIILRGWSEGNKRFISVKDNGGGISEDKLTRIFEPFYTTKHYGTGLGLSICENIIRELNGEIHVTSSEKNTEFKIILVEKEV